jgi:hypothetical protein
MLKVGPTRVYMDLQDLVPGRLSKTLSQLPPETFTRCLHTVVLSVICPERLRYWQKSTIAQCRHKANYGGMEVWEVYLVPDQIGTKSRARVVCFGLLAPREETTCLRLGVDFTVDHCSGRQHSPVYLLSPPYILKMALRLLEMACPHPTQHPRPFPPLQTLPTVSLPPPTYPDPLQSASTTVRLSSDS